MKILSLLTLALIPAAASAAPLIDFSEGPSVALSALMPAEENAILDQLFPKHVKDFADCVDGEEEQTEVIINGVQAVRGHFASTSADDLVLIFKSVRCNGGHAGEHPNVALVRDGKVLSYSQDLSTEDVYKMIDADGDGLADLISTASYSNMGYTGSWAQTITFKGAKPAALNFVQGTVHYDDCGLDGRTEGEFNAVFFASKERPGSILQKNYRKACGASRRHYKHYSNGVLDKEL